MYDKWSLDVLYSGFDDPKFQTDVKEMENYIHAFDTLAASLGTKDENCPER